MRNCWSIVLLTIFIPLMSCDLQEVIPVSDLEVYVSGSLSGKPREGIKVVLYLSREDAEKEVNAITSTNFTDNYGITIFFNLEGNMRYWVRADPLLFETIRQTPNLKSGLNEFSISVL